ncbi:protein PECTIC ARABINOGALACTAN SYNTHESIS-RELATED-like [Miscanthus floridulus]|uniref:protein PECTIC ARABINOGALACTAN SYNTHESIS-RELATED-like n=1 Tax=Miscanthus floridulus TaxID=154761 RepID=UPI00345B3312
MGESTCCHYILESPVQSDAAVSPQICNAVAIAKIMRATLILPVLKQDQILKDQSKFEDIFDVDHFINYLKDDVRIVRDIPDWFTEEDELFTSIKMDPICGHWHCRREKKGRCPLEPGEIAVILRALGYTSGTQIYVASGRVYGRKNRMAPLRNMFPNLVTTEELASAEELAPFRRHVTSLAALDFLVCLRSDVFVMTHGGNFAKLIIGALRYAGHRLKSVKPDKGLMSKSLGDPDMGWASFAEDVVVTHRTRTGLPEPTSPATISGRTRSRPACAGPEPEGLPESSSSRAIFP